MKEFLFLLASISKGSSITRGILNFHLKGTMLKGKILDLGSGGQDLYSKYIPHEAGSTFELLDIKQGSSINFESDTLPFDTKSYDVILLLNVLEHLFNYNNLLKEIYRIKKEDGTLIGFVPFLMWYHPDHHDFFRYTHEALDQILKDVGYKEISIKTFYKGPYSAAFQMIYPTLPRFLRPIIFSINYFMDFGFSLFRAESAKRYALGYYFTAR